MESVFDAVISADRCTRCEEGQRSSGPHGQLEIPWTWRCHPRIDFWALRCSVGAPFTSWWFCLWGSKRKQVDGGWKYLNYWIYGIISTVESEVNQRLASCRYIAHRCRIINPSCHSQGLPIWLAAPLKVMAYISRWKHPLTDNLIDRCSGVSSFALQSLKGRWRSGMQKMLEQGRVWRRNEHMMKTDCVLAMLIFKKKN